jgi:cbb3-type cytochrome c oxidase subunit III
MKMTRLLCCLAAVIVPGAAARAQQPVAQPPVVTQAPAETNPLQGDPEAIRNGMGQFRVRCADCHGMDATGVRGPDITQVWASGRTDHGLFLTVRNGVPNTEMPSVGQRTTDLEIWQILAYLRTLAAPAPSDPPRGNAENGERIFRANCAGCHSVNGRGGRIGPDLSRIGNARSRDVLVRRIVGAI